MFGGASKLAIKVGVGQDWPFQVTPPAERHVVTARARDHDMTGPALACRAPLTGDRPLVLVAGRPPPIESDRQLGDGAAPPARNPRERFHDSRAVDARASNRHGVAVPRGS